MESKCMNPSESTQPSLFPSGQDRPGQEDSGMSHTVGISEMKVTTNPADILVTYSLGSCVGLTLYDPITKVGGIIHCMLPLSRVDAVKATKIPCMFVDTGVTSLIQAVLDLGGTKKHLVAKVAGASKIMDDKGMFKIGERNYTVLRKVLWKNNILIAAESVGGADARTMTLYMANGRTTIKTRGTETELE